MREIKFRAWDKDNKKIYNPEITGAVGSLVAQVFSLTIYQDQNSMFDDDEYNLARRNVGRFEFMQYTGLKDRNDVEIYEGDIVQTYVPDGRGTLCKHRVRAIDWYESTAHIGWNLGIGRKANRGGVLRYTEVIGNIYENHELLAKT